MSTATTTPGASRPAPAAPAPTAHAARPTALPLFRKAMADSWRSVLGWLVGLTAVMMLYMPLYPTLSGNAQMQQLLNTLPPQLMQAIGYTDITSGAGYAQATFFGLLGFVLATIAAVTAGAAAIGADEESGRLELTLAHGVTRVQVILERYLALLLRLAIMAAWVFVLLLLLSQPAQLKLDVGRMVIECLMFLGLVLLSGSAAFFGGALVGRRIWGLGLGAAVAVVGYIFNALGNESDDLKWLHHFSPYSWAYAAKPLMHDVGVLPYVGLYGWSLVCLVLAAVVLAKRDVRN